MTALIPWRNPLRRTKATVREVILELTLDDRGFVDGMRRSSDAIKEHRARHRFRFQIELERRLGRQFVCDLMDTWRAELGFTGPNGNPGDSADTQGPRRSPHCDCDDGEVDQ